MSGYPSSKSITNQASKIANLIGTNVDVNHL